MISHLWNTWTFRLRNSNVSFTGGLLSLVLCQGFLSMGFQLVASRLLAPYFGTTLIVWAFLISTFLMAFSFGSFLGGTISQFEHSRRFKTLVVVAMLGCVAFGLDAIAGRTILRLIEIEFADAWVGIGLSCLLLFFVPVLCLSSLLPVYADVHGGTSRRVGTSSGVVYGTSTVGNILGVMITAFVLIPNFATSHLLFLWFALSIFCFAVTAGAIRLWHSE